MLKLIVDTGPLVALFDSSDLHHSRAVEFVSLSKSPLGTTLPVITETMFLLDFSVLAQRDFLCWIHQGGLQVVELSSNDFKRTSELMMKYASVPMDFADATIVAVCERQQTREIVTTDSDFKIYRCMNKLPFVNLFDKVPH